METIIKKFKSLYADYSVYTLDNSTIVLEDEQYFTECYLDEDENLETETYLNYFFEDEDRKKFKKIDYNHISEQTLKIIKKLVCVAEQTSCFKA